MFPAPTTTAVSTPSDWTPAISRASRSTVARSIPYSRSPIRASPESFSRMRRKTGAAVGSAASSLVRAGALPNGNAPELEHLQARLLERLRDGLRGVVDPHLFGEHRLRVEALLEHAFDDLLTDLLGLGEHVRLRGVDLELGLDVLLGDLVAREVPRLGERDVHRQLPRSNRALALDADEHADLVRGRMDVLGERLAFSGLHAGGVDDDDVLSEPGDELGSRRLELLQRVTPVPLDRLERLLGEREELCVLGDGLG